MNAPQLITHLQALGVRFSFDPTSDRVRVDAPRGVLTQQLKEEIAEAKPQIIERLAAIDDTRSGGPCGPCGPGPGKTSPEASWWSVFNLRDGMRLSGGQFRQLCMETVGKPGPALLKHEYAIRNEMLRRYGHRLDGGRDTQ